MSEDIHIADMANTGAVRAEARLRAQLLRRVRQRRNQRRALRLASTSLVVLIGVGLLFSVRSFGDRAAPTSPPSFVLATEPLWQPVASQPEIQRISTVPLVQRVPTRATAVTLVDDRQLEATFDERAYAALEEGDRIRAFYVLDDGEAASAEP